MINEKYIIAAIENCFFKKINLRIDRASVEEKYFFKKDFNEALKRIKKTHKKDVLKISEKNDTVYIVVFLKKKK